MNAILSADMSWCIGKNGGLLFHVPEDMKFFKNTTIGHTVVMGRLTFESLPGKKPLPGRRNIILSSSVKSIEGAEVAAGTAELMGLISSNIDDVFVMGGANVYRQMLPYCDIAHVTKMDYVYQADAYLADLDQDPQWLYAAESEEKTYFDLEYQFVMYIRKDRLDQLKHMNL